MTNKYLRTIYGVDKEGNAGSLQVDVYDILDAYPTRNPALDHLIKKALCPGQRGHKDLLTDLDDIIKSAQRAKQMAVNKKACTTEVTLNIENVPELTAELEKALQDGGAKVRFEPGDPTPQAGFQLQGNQELERATTRQDKSATNARPNSFKGIDTIYVFLGVLGNRNIDKLEDAADHICRITPIRDIREAPIGSAVVGSFKTGDKTVYGRHCFNLNEAISILSADQLHREAAATFEQAGPGEPARGYKTAFKTRPTSFIGASVYILEGIDEEDLAKLEHEIAQVDVIPDYVRGLKDCPDWSIVIRPNKTKPLVKVDHRWYFTVSQAINILVNDQKGNTDNA